MTDHPIPTPCPEHEDACLATAWGLDDDPTWAAHRRGCFRCQEALEAARSRAEDCKENPPERVRANLAASVFARTTRAPARRPSGWGWAGAAFAATGAAYLALRPEEVLPPEGEIPLAAMDLDLLEDLDLAENLDLLELFDALEALEDA